MSNAKLIFERASLISGLGLLSLTALIWLGGAAQGRSAVLEFEQARQLIASNEDQLLWSEKRRADYKHSLSQDVGPTLAVMRIPSVGIEAPVFDNVEERALNRGIGHVESTALPGTAGNIAIAGHRDGFFRGLKDIEVGATIEISTLEGERVFRVSELSIVDPLDVSPLDPADKTILTLITCYPFYYIGSAPERFIVRAVLSHSAEQLN